MRELGIKEAMASHEGDLEDILRPDFHGVTPEDVNEVRIQVVTCEHCPLRDLNFCGGNGIWENIFLKDRRTQHYPIIANLNGYQSRILRQKQTNWSTKKEELKKAGIKRFRIYVE